MAGPDDLQGVHPSRLALLTDDSSSAANQTANQTQNQNTQPSTQAGSLFGGSTQTSQPQQGGSLFGNTSNAQTSQPQQSGGLFGSTTTQQPQQQQQSSLFGNTTSQQPQPQQQSGGLFGSTTAQQPQQQSGGGLFGASTQQPQQSGGGGGMFGSSTMPASQPQQSSGLFSSLGQSTQPQQSIFGNSQNNSLFGNKDTTQTIGGNMFYNSQNPQSKPVGTSVFGMNAVPASQLPSLLTASQYTQNSRPAPFASKLSMGQGASGNQPAPLGTVGAVKVNLAELRPTTRFQDCIDDVKKDFETMDDMIRKQETFCREIQAFITKHEGDVKTIAPDVALVKEKADAVEQVLAADAQAVERSRRVNETDRRDFARCQRVVENQHLPAGYRVPDAGLMYGSNSVFSQPRLALSATGTGEGNDDDVYDTDLIGNYFLPLAASLQTTLTAYASNLAEIEAHMKVIEGSAVAQAQQLAAKRAGIGSSGGGSGSGGEDTVRELADTLRGFEQSIMGVAGSVGQCREGVNELVMGRLSEGSSRRAW